MLLLIIALAQAASPDAELRKDVVQTTGPSYTAEIAPMVNEYHSCLLPPEGLTWTAGSSVSWEEMFRDRITACAEVRKWAVSAATSAFRPIPGGETRAEVYVNKTFDAIDETLLRSTQIVTDEIGAKVRSESRPDRPVSKSETDPK